MIIVHVEYCNCLADYAGKKEEEISIVEGASLRQLIRFLAELHSPTFHNVALCRNAPGPFLRVFHNGKPLERQQLGTHLVDGDEIKLFPQIVGKQVV
ncbi:MAG TPA: MoaD/ThiS family protein [Longilinea sp.]|nr:MoaD/ThiS family protein [Longilinea sp.]